MDSTVGRLRISIIPLPPQKTKTLQNSNVWHAKFYYQLDRFGVRYEDRHWSGGIAQTVCEGLSRLMTDVGKAQATVDGN